VDLTSEKLFESCQAEFLSEAASRYGIKTDSLKKLGSFESIVYEFAHKSRDYIMKITHSRRRTPDLIRAELDWTQYLLDHGVSVSRAIPSINGELLEVIDGRTVEALDDDYFLVYAAEKATGKHTERVDWTEPLIREWGRMIGRMNALAKSFIPATPSRKRFGWYEDHSPRIEKHIPPSQPHVIEKIQNLLAHMRTWPVDDDSFGIIHADVHHGNFLSEEGRLTVFDFDDCHYCWFGFDIMIPLFYVMRDHEVDSNDIEYARWFLDNFLEGYRRENSIDGVWIKRIPDFMKLREIDLYSVIYAEEAFDINGWCRRFFKDRQSRIENDVPVIDLDFSEFA